jgi:hypothetical protein
MRCGRGSEAVAILEVLTQEVRVIPTRLGLCQLVPPNTDMLIVIRCRGGGTNVGCLGFDA